MPRLGNRLVDLVPRQLAALSGLGALGNFDLQLVGVDQVPARYAEATGRHLLDGAAPRVSVRFRNEARRILTTLSGVAPRPDSVHRDGQRLVGLERDRAIGHGAGAEALHDFRSRLDFLQRDR